MSDSASFPAKALIERLVVGDDGAVDELVPLVYAELRDLAERMLAHESKAQSLQPTALVHEVYVRLAGAEERGWQAKARFAAVAVRSMRQVLVDRARRRNAKKRGGGRDQVTISAVPGSAAEHDVLLIDDAMSRLAEVQPRAARILELSVFADLKGKEIAEVIGVSLRTVEKDLAIARGWLARELDLAE